MTRLSQIMGEQNDYYDSNTHMDYRTNRGYQYICEVAEEELSGKIEEVKTQYNSVSMRDRDIIAIRADLIFANRLPGAQNKYRIYVEKETTNKKRLRDKKETIKRQGKNKKLIAK